MLCTSMTQARRPWRPTVAVALAALLSTLIVMAGAAHADPPTVQIEDFHHPDGTPVLSDGGMPFAHAALFRFANQNRPRIVWQIMTQRLEPGEPYDIWIEGPDGGTGEGAFRWWVGTARATTQGDLDAIGTVETGRPPGESHGEFEDPAAAMYLVITTDGEDVVQTAYFPTP